MKVKHYKKMFTYNYWANDKVWEHILTLTDEQFTRPCDYSIGSLHEQVVHVMGAEELWLDRIRENPNSKPFATVTKYPTRDEIALHWKKVQLEWFKYLDTLTEDDLEGNITFESMTYGKTMSNQRWEGLMQILNHSTDHRAQILSLIHQVGGHTSAQDFIYYSWEQ